MKNLDTSNMTIEQIWQHGYEEGKASLSFNANFSKEVEYLDENFKLHIVKFGSQIIPENWIQIPEGAESATLHKYGALHFWRGSCYKTRGNSHEWNDMSIHQHDYTVSDWISNGASKLVWKRHLTRDQFREKLAFMKNGDEIEIDGWKVYFGDGKFGYINKGKGGSTPSLKDVLDHIFEGN